MKVSDKWVCTSNNGDVVTLRRDTEETLEESTIERPENTDVESWKALWPVGASYGNAEYHDRVRFEAVRRKPVGVMTTSEAWTLERWNRKDSAIKQVTDGMESLRVFLKNTEQVSMLEYARLMYIKHSTRPGIAAEYAAINSEASLYAFINRCEDASPVDTESLDELLKRAQREGFWKGRQ